MLKINIFYINIASGKNVWQSFYIIVIIWKQEHGLFIFLFFSI